MYLAAVTGEDVLLAYGPLGLGVLVLGYFGIFMFRRLIKEVDELRAQRETMITTLLEVVPLMRRSTDIHEKRQRADEEFKGDLGEFKANTSKALDDINGFIRDLRRELGMRT